MSQESAPARTRQVIDGLQSLRGVAKLSAITIVAELGQVSRFASAPHLMGYVGVVSSERSSGERVRRGWITKCGNAHLRRIVVEAAWAYRFRPVISRTLAAWQRTDNERVRAIAWKAQHRLHSCYCRLVGRGKCRQQVVAAVGRELLGFIWAIGIELERGADRDIPQAA